MKHTKTPLSTPLWLNRQRCPKIF